MTRDGGDGAGQSNREADPASVSARLAQRIGDAIDGAGGWIPFSRFMAMALYEPGLGYYASGRPVFGRGPGDGSDFVTAPELSPLFGRALAVQIAEALEATGTREVFEFGAGSGALARELLASLGGKVERYSIIELSAPLRERQHEATREFGAKMRWLNALPDEMRGVVVGNEVLDAMPVDIVRWDGERWLDRGVTRATSDPTPTHSLSRLRERAGVRATTAATDLAPQLPTFAWHDRPASNPPTFEMAKPIPSGYITETHSQAEAFIATLASKLERGAAFLIDYGFPAAEFFHPQREGGTIACHCGHRVDFDPLADVGLKDITAHVNFTAIALAGQGAGFDVAGYTSQGRFLLNCGIGKWLETATVAQRADAQKLLNEHEMGELFKAIALTKDVSRYGPLGFASGDRRNRL